MIPGPLASLPTAAAVEVGGSAGAAHPDLGVPAAVEGAAPNHSSPYSETLRQIVALVEHGIPAPEQILVVDGEVTVAVAREHLPAWVIALDLPVPEWLQLPMPRNLGVLHMATWPDAVALTLLFRLSCNFTEWADDTVKGCPLTCSVGLSGCTGECR